ncbi:MAG TPA: hypothetical protein DEH78_04540, partial [Solibacterales bacterium]|nr:hypothetical protein [Bryobacterales bacterium]
ARNGVIEDRLDGQPIVLFYSADGLSPVDAASMSQSRAIGSIGVFRAENANSRIRFRRADNRIEDRQTGSAWNITGVAIDGSNKGKSLQPVEHGVFFAFAWLAFQPDTVIVGESTASSGPQP